MTIFDYPWRVAQHFCGSNALPREGHALRPGVGAGVLLTLSEHESLGGVFRDVSAPLVVGDGQYVWVELPGPSFQGDEVDALALTIIGDGGAIKVWDIPFLNKWIWPDEEGLHQGDAAKAYGVFFEGLVRRTLEARDIVYPTNQGAAAVMDNVTFTNRFITQDDQDGAQRATIAELSVTLPGHLREIRVLPKRILLRRRDHSRIDRIQELDSACLLDYAQRPGRTPAEKAGQKQRLLAVQRTETLNTLENRVTLDLCRRALKACRRYEKLNTHVPSEGSPRRRAVNTFMQYCLTYVDDSVFAEVAHLPTPCRVPNYALLQNPRYVAIWRAYEALLRDADLRAEVWRWSRRAWADLTRLMFVRAVSQVMEQHMDSVVRVILQKHPKVFRRHSCGKWLRRDPYDGPYILKQHNGRLVTVYIVDQEQAGHIGEVGQWSAMLNADYYLVVLDELAVTLMPVWVVCGDCSLSDVKERSAYIRFLVEDIQRSISCLEGRRQQASPLLSIPAAILMLPMFPDLPGMPLALRQAEAPDRTVVRTIEASSERGGWSGAVSTMVSMVEDCLFHDLGD